MLITKKIPLRYILESIKWDVLRVAILSIVAFVTFQYIDLPDTPLSIPAFLGTAISLVLGFKLSHSYDRWWEARKIWGAIVNDSRSFIIQVRNFVSGSDDKIKKIALRQIAWNYSLGQSLRKLDGMQGMEKYVSEEELGFLQKNKNVPLALMHKHGSDIGQLLKDGQINEYQHVQLDATLVRFVESMGKAERIKNTVFPTTYSLYLHFFIYVFVVLLGIAMAETVGYWEIPRLVIISLPFFLLEKVSNYLQDPFENRPTDTSMTAIAKTIDTNIREILEMDDLPEPQKVEDFYLM